MTRYLNSNLSVLAYANNFTLWHYTTTEDDDITVPGYFNKNTDLLLEGDLMIVVYNTDKKTTTTKLFVVSHNDGTNVNIAPFV